MHHHTEHSFVDEFRWVSTLHYLKNEWQNAVPLWCMSQAGPPFLHYCCAVMLNSCIVLPPVGHSSNHEYHCCQLTRQSSGVSNFYRTFKVFIWLSLAYLGVCGILDFKVVKGSYSGLCVNTKYNRVNRRQVHFPCRTIQWRWASNVELLVEIYRHSHTAFRHVHTHVAIMIKM